MVSRERAIQEKGREVKENKGWGSKRKVVERVRKK
jgi:hypothetical protein